MSIMTADIHSLHTPALTFILEDLAKSGLVPDDFELSPSDLPAIKPVEESKTLDKVTYDLYGYSMAFPAPDHSGQIAKFSIRRYANHPDHKYDSTPGMTFPFWATKADDWLEADVKWIVEGEKKALATRKYMKVPCIGMRGCWGWSRGKGMMEEILDNIKPRDTIVLLIDGDLALKNDIQRAVGTMARFFIDKEVTVIVPLLPYDKRGKRMGADDWIMSFPPEKRTPDRLQKELAKLARIDWRDLPEEGSYMTRRLDLMTDAKGNAIRNDENTRHILADIFGEAALFYDQYKGPMYQARGKEAVPYTDDTLDSELFRFIERSFGTWSKESFRSVRRALIAQTKRNLLGEYVKSIQWDGRPRVETMLITYFGAEDTNYARKVSKGTCLGSIGRLMDPGTKWDHVLILEGKQRTGKSYGLELLYYEYYVSVKMGIDSAALARQACSAWCVNCDELDHMNKAGREAFKAWVTERVENWVPKYVEYAKSTPRGFVITGTTNDHSYLDDPTGAQRFWPIRVATSRTKVDHEALLRDRDQIWAEAYHLYRLAPDTWWAEFENDRTGALEEQEHRAAEDPLTDILFAALSVSNRPKDADGKEFVTFHWLTQLAQNANLPPVKKSIPAIVDAAVRLNLHKKQIYRSHIDPASLSGPCRDGSQRRIVDDQFPEGFVPERMRVYYLPEIAND